ncbi:27 kDa glycoprotein precursor [Bombyx mori]|uniref:27 kDa glycoprotein n=1 Tax=Bombyx mori TaxID=7091 RepID=P27K_BOMMO|nr:27 kDa glycoprotein precursor [Bombyx mori]Q8T113.1 RecName: Full=27 kDa glycoprotein; AltName: Full=P27K; Flags: Precursor [Bombyx mori]BAB87849.1 p27K [Bombyx mori]
MMWKTVLITIFAAGVLADDFSQITAVVTSQCTKNNAEDKVPEVEAALRTFGNCLKGLVDLNVLKTEIEEAKPNGALDEVFKKYCDKSAQLKGCISSVLQGVRPCVGNEYANHINDAQNSTNQLIDFVCYKDGDRIALFIAEGGPECFQQKTENLKTCFLNLKQSFPTVESANNLSLVEKCAKVDEMTSCIVKSLEECSTPTPANMAESLIKFMRKDSPCHTALPKTD